MSYQRCQDARFALPRERLGDSFVAVELDDSAANPNSLIPPHSVLTEHLIDEPCRPTRQVLDLFHRRLLAPTEASGATDH
ncbi:hypothetical protein ACF09K_29885 [Streptomyces sp. NPDC014882]|uniref:hypothetical protein n=1 Tax=Streptomyces sp. NPDC014882 TaxID=3364927 RepID=UPI0036FE3A8E